MRFVVLALLVLAGCATPAKVATSLEFGSAAGGLTTISVHIKNEDVRATTPLLINVTVAYRDGVRWVDAESVTHPAAFVLKKGEEQIIRTTAKLKPGTVRAVLSVHEQESGREVVNKTFEKTIPG